LYSSKESYFRHPFDLRKYHILVCVIFSSIQIRHSCLVSKGERIMVVSERKINFKFKLELKSILATALTVMILSGTVVMASSSYLANLVYAQQQATLNVVTQVRCVPSLPNCPTPSQISLEVNGNNPVPSSFSGSSTGTIVNLGPGQYQVSITGQPVAPAGYTFTNDFSGCNDIIGAGQSFRCDILVTYFQPSSLNVIKQVECPSGVVCPQPFDFTIGVTGTGARPNFFSGSDEGTIVTLGQGTFFVDEVAAPNPPAGHVLIKDFSNCNGQITGSGQFLECIITNKYLPDADGDGLADTWETNGIDWNNDGTVDYVIPGADPNRKNLYMEIDYMQFHRPIGGLNVFGSGSVIESLRAAFRNAPVSNPDGSTGITLSVQLDNQIPHQDLTTLDQLKNTIKPMWFGTDQERSSPNRANLLSAKAQVFHYGLFAHDQPGANAGSAGVADLPGMNLLATLGNPSWPLNSFGNHSIGTQTQQTFNLMHEQGHNLNLRHGGNENTNCKTNYFSVMSYLYSLGDTVRNAPLDYSRSILPSLNKGSLLEQNGLGQSTPPGLPAIYGPTPPPQGPGFKNAGSGAIDWNWNGAINPQPVSSDINGGLNCGTPGPPGATGVLNGFNDWNSILYIPAPSIRNPIPSPAAAMMQEQMTISDEEPEPEPDPETPVERTMEDVRETRLMLLNGINNAIFRITHPLGESGPSSQSDSQPQTAPEFDTSHIAELLQTDQLAAAIAELNKLKVQVVTTYGEEASAETVSQIDNLVGVLELQIPSPPPPPPASDCIGVGSTNSIISGTSSPDILIGTSGNNIISGLGKDDSISGCAGNDRLSGNDGNDGIDGGSGNDLIHGNDGDDILYGGPGNDWIFGDAGQNILTGGPGRDIFVCGPEGDIITDFVPRQDTKSGNCILPGPATGSSASGSLIASSSSSSRSSSPEPIEDSSATSPSGSLPLEILPLPLPE
jgi:hypothetical protein